MKEIKLSKRAMSLGPSIIFSIKTRAKELGNVIDFSVGEPDFDTPENIKEAARKAINQGFTKYTPVGGIDELKKAIIEKFKRDQGVEYKMSEIAVSCGAKHSLYNLAQVLFDEGDEVIIFAPYWESYIPTITLAGANPVVIEDIDSLEKAASRRTKAVIINSPGNPSGLCLKEEEIRKISIFCQKRGIWLISDEIYEKIVYDGFKHFSPISLGNKNRTIVVNGVSKAYAMTGWRIGYLAAPEPIARAVTKLQTQITTNPTSISQKAAVEALSGPQESVEAMRKAFEERRNLVLKLLDGLHLKVIKPQGAFYIFPDFSFYLGNFNGRKINNTIELADYLLEEGRIAAVPGEAFGMPGHIRLSFATSIENIEEGLKRLKEALLKLRNSDKKNENTKTEKSLRGIIERKFRPIRIIDNPPEEELRKMALLKGARLTKFGSLAAVSQTRNRMTKSTEIIFNPSQETIQLVKNVLKYLERKEVIQLDRTICQNQHFKTGSRLYITSDFSRIPLMWGKTLFPPNGRNPEFITISVPEWPEKKVLVFPEEKVSIILGSDYVGEHKMSMLRLLLYKAKKERNSLGCHAASKVVKMKFGEELKEMGLLLFGLSGTGKTSLTFHDHWLKPPEKIVVKQDDIVVLTPKAKAIGTELSFYVKTDGLSPEIQPLYSAAVGQEALLENVMVKETGEIDFADSTLTSNGRAVVLRSNINLTDQSIDLNSVDFIFFITRRNDVVPPIIKLSPEWAAIAFLLGESVETSAGDPTQAGKSVRVVGTNPFIIGPPEEETNLLYNVLKRNPHIQCFLLNTGYVGGTNGKKITLSDSSYLMKMAIKGKIQWAQDQFWGYLVPKAVEGMDISAFDPEKYYDKETVIKLNQSLKEERLEWISKFENNLHPDIAKLI